MASRTLYNRGTLCNNEFALKDIILIEGRVESLSYHAGV